MKKALQSIAKWTWFLVLIAVAFGYMASGLSDSSSVEEDVTPVSRQATADADAGSVATTPDSVAELISAVNEIRTDELNRMEIESAERADWLTVCRRLSLGLVGSGMSLEEIRHLETLPVESREAAHLDNLLSDPRFHNYWAERWTRFLVGADDGPFIVYRRRRFRVWLTEMLADNKPYDEIVSSLISAKGLWTDRPEVNFLTVTFDSNDGNPDPIRLAARTSRAFLGLRIDCLQCHNDFLGNVNLGDSDALREGMQTDFHQLAAFYSAAKTNGIQGIQDAEADYQYQYLYADEEVPVEPAVPYRADLLPDEGDARSRLATWVTHEENIQFSRAAIVRFWSLMFGRPPVDAVDNLPLDEPFPAILQPIVEDFREHRDIRRAIRIIAGSDAFRVDSEGEFDISEEHESRFAVYPLVRLRSEQVAGAIAQAARVKSVNRNSSFLVQLIRFGSINDFLKRYGDLGENEFADDGITIPQRLVMLNGKMLRESGESNPLLNSSAHANMFARSDTEAIETIFLCLLNRYPTDSESEYFIEQLADRDDRSAAMEDYFWTLANTTEFAWNH